MVRHDSPISLVSRETHFWFYALTTSSPIIPLPASDPQPTPLISPSYSPKPLSPFPPNYILYSPSTNIFASLTHCLHNQHRPPFLWPNPTASLLLPLPLQTKHQFNNDTNLHFNNTQTRESFLKRKPIPQFFISFQIQTPNFEVDAPNTNTKIKIKMIEHNTCNCCRRTETKSVIICWLSCVLWLR